MSIARLMQMARAGVPAGPVWLADLANASYDSVSFSVAGQDGDGRGLFFKPDGTKFYFIDLGAFIYEYNLSTAWDLSTASFSQSLDIPTPADASGSSGLFFDPSGEILFIITGATDSIYQYNLTTAWDISTASYGSVSFSVSAQEGSPAGLFFKSDGTKMYHTGTSGVDINEYNLSTAWDISTASYVQSFSVASQETAPRGLVFSPDGFFLYITGTSSDSVHEYSLSTAWDISTASYAQSFSVASQDTAPVDLSFKEDGSKLYILGVSNDTIYQYSTA